MAKTVGLRIEIEGLSDITKGIVGLESEIKGLNEQLKQTEVGSDEYIKLRNRIAEAKEELKGARKEQRDFIKQANTAKFKKGSYFDLNEQLKKLRKEFKNLSAEERKGAAGKQLTQQIQKLDKELKQADASIGQFQRNVGNYRQAIDGIIPGFSRFSKAITNAQGKLNVFGKALIAGFVAFKGAQLIGRAVKQLDEFITKIDETQQAVAGLSGATGEELEQLTAQTSALATTFNVSSDQIAKSAEALSKQLGIGFDEALAKIEGRLVEGVANNEEFLSTIQEYPEAFQDATGAVSELSQRNERLLGTNKELAASQVEVANKLKPTVEAIKQVGEQVKTGLLVFLSQLITTFKPVVGAVQEWGKSLARLIGQIFGAGDATRGLNNILKGLATALTFAANVTTLFFDGLSAGIAFLRGDASVAFKLFTREGQILAQAEEQLAETTKSLTKEFQQETSELNNLFGQLANTNKNTDERRKLIKQLNDQYGEYLPNIDLEKAGQEELADAYEATTRAIAQNLIDRKKIELQSKAQQQLLEDNIELEKARQNLLTSAEAVKATDASIKGIQDIGTALTKGRKEFQAFQKAQREFNRLQKEVAQNTEANKKEIELLEKASGNLVNTLSQFITVDELATKEQKKNTEERKGLTKEELKARQDAFNKLLKAREKFAKDELKAERARAALLADLNARLIDEQIKNIEDATDRRIAEINNSFDAQVNAFEKGNTKLQQQAEAREQQLIKTFGEGSKEVLQAREAFNKDLEAIEAEQAKIIIELEKQKQEDLKKAQEEGRAKEVEEARKVAEQLRQFRDQALSSELAFIDEGANLRALKRQEALNNEIASLEDAKEREAAIEQKAIEDIADKRLTLQQKLRAIQDQEDNLKANAEEGVEIKQEEYDAILLARQQLNTELSALELQETELKRQEAAKREAIEKQAAEAQKEAAQASFEFLKGLLDRRDQDEQEKLDAAAQRSQERQSQLTDEISNATGLRKKFLEQQLQQELANEKQLEQQKEKIAKRAAIRDKATAIAQSIIQGILATQRAAAAPPGPPLNTPVVIATAIAAAARTAAIASQKFEDGGMIEGPAHSQGGVPFTVQGRGGFEAEGGEFIVNKKSTAKFLPLLQKINSVKFAEGGMIGGIPTVPNVTGLSVGAADSLRAFNDRTEAIRQSIMRTQVVLSTDELDEDNDNKTRIQKRVRLE